MQKPIAVALMALCARAAVATQSSIPFINADDVHALGITGMSVTVAVIDSGVLYAEHGLIGSIANGGISVINGTRLQDAGQDIWVPYSQAHGTSMSLIVTDVSGVAPNALILPIRVFHLYDIGGQLVWTALPSDVANAIRYVVERRAADQSISVINLSLGWPEYACLCDNDDADASNVADAISEAADTGIITFAATGNDGTCGAIYAPACTSRAVRVAANYDLQYPTTDFDFCGDFIPPPYRVTCFSNIVGDCDWLIAAPGYDIDIGGLADGWGTSPAAAHCSGVAALMFEKNLCGALSADTAKTIIFNTATVNDWAYPYCPFSPQPRHINAWTAVNAVSAGPCVMLADLDCDGTISGFDTPKFTACMTGPGGGLASMACSCADLPSSPPDGDVDLQDYAAFQLLFTGYGAGACCHADGSCTEEAVVDCISDPNSVYEGHDTTCATVECPLPNWGACCDVATQACTESTREDCVWAEGFYMGDGTDCGSATCPTPRYQNVIDPLTTSITAGPGRQLADDITLSGTGPYRLAFYDLGVYDGGGGTFNVTVGLYTDCPGDGGTLIVGTERTFTNNPDNGSPVFLQAVFNPPVSIPGSFWMVVTFSTNQAGWFRAEQAEIGFTDNLFGKNTSPWQCNLWFGESYYAGFWANVGCVDPEGACCHPNESCTEGTQAQCTAAGGSYRGDDTTCVGMDCSATTIGACCDYDDGSCSETIQSTCEAAGGSFQGNGTVCAGTTCPFGRYRNEISPLDGYATQSPSTALADDMTLAGTGARDLEYYDLMVFGNGGGTFNATVSLYTGCPGAGGTLIPGTTNTWTGIPDDGWAHLLQRDLSASPVTIPTTVWMVVQFSSGQAAWLLAGQAEVGSTANTFGANDPPWVCNYWFGSTDPWAGFWANLRCVDNSGMRSGGEPTSSTTPVTLSGPVTRIEYEPLAGAPSADERVLDTAGEHSIGGDGFTAGPWTNVDATVALELRPVGGGQSVSTLQPDTAYEVHYVTDGTAADRYLLFAVAESPRQGMINVVPPTAGDWAGAGSFNFLTLPTAEAWIPADVRHESANWFQIAFDHIPVGESSAGANGHLCTVTTGRSGPLDLELLMESHDEDALVHATMTTKASFAVAD